MSRAWFQAAVTLAISCVFCAVPAAAWADEGTLQTIRDDVRQGPPSSPTNSGSSSNDWLSDVSDLLNSDDGLSYFIYGLAGVTSPFWAPHYLLDDDFSDDGYFCHFPCEGKLDYIEKSLLPGQTRPLAIRLDAEYVATFDRLDDIAGHLLVETAPRFGLAASWNSLEERLADGGRDTLSLGDCNLVYRFAQAPWAEFRTGCGLNWMADSGTADFGFNFIYAADFYPCKPWVLSSELDGGTLGRAGLFRFRATAGIMLHGVETYVGYQYTDIGREHWNGLVGGLRVWF